MLKKNRLSGLDQDVLGLILHCMSLQILRGPIKANWGKYSKEFHGFRAEGLDREKLINLYLKEILCEKNEELINRIETYFDLVVKKRFGEKIELAETDPEGFALWALQKDFNEMDGMIPLKAVFSFIGLPKESERILAYENIQGTYFSHLEKERAEAIQSTVETLKKEFQKKEKTLAKKSDEAKKFKVLYQHEKDKAENLCKELIKQEKEKDYKECRINQLKRELKEAETKLMEKEEVLREYKEKVMHQRVELDEISLTLSKVRDEKQFLEEKTFSLESSLPICRDTIEMMQFDRKSKDELLQIVKKNVEDAQLMSFTDVWKNMNVKTEKYLEKIVASMEENNSGGKEIELAEQIENHISVQNVLAKNIKVILCSYVLQKNMEV